MQKNLKKNISGVNTPRGGLKESNLPSARKVSWELHHDVFKFGKFSNEDLGSDPTCPPEKRSTPSDPFPEPKEFNQQCPNGTDKSTGARLGGNGDLATHMVRTTISYMVWSPKVTHSHSWSFMVTSGHTWSHMVTHGHN